MTRNLLLFVFLGLALPDSASAALISSLTVNIGPAGDGRTRYEYTLTNDAASEFPLDVFLLDTGSDVELEITAPEGWDVDFAPEEGTYELAFGTDGFGALEPGESGVFTVLTAAAPAELPFFLANLDQSFEEGGYIFDFILSPSEPYSLNFGDTNEDGLVDLEDLNNVRNHFGEAGEPVFGDTEPYDGDVDLDDLNAVRNNFGKNYNPGAPAPEPATWMLAAIAGMAFATRKGWSTLRP